MRSRRDAGRDLTGRVAVVTGGARGIGRETVALLVREGGRVALCDLDETVAKTAADETGAVLGVGVDVADLPAYTAFLDRVEREVGPVDILVNNAGIMPITRLEDESDESTAVQIGVNLAAVIHGSKEVARRLIDRGAAGHIVNVSSGLGRVPMAGLATYAATKHGVTGFSLSIAAQFRLDGAPIDVTAVHPNVVRTQLAAGFEAARSQPSVGPEQVAAAIVEALRHPREEVYVPASLGPTIRYASALPAVVGRRIAKALDAERLGLRAIGHPDRLNYEQRVVRRTPVEEDA